MSYLSKRNALYGGIVAFFFFPKKSAFLVILDMLNIAYPGLLFFFSWKPQIEDILDVSKLFSDTKRLEKVVACHKLLKTAN